MSKKPSALLASLAKMDLTGSPSAEAPAPVAPVTMAEPAPPSVPKVAAPPSVPAAPSPAPAAFRSSLAQPVSTPPATVAAVRALPNRHKPQAAKVSVYLYETDLAHAEGLLDFLRELGYRKVTTSTALKVALRHTIRNKTAALGKIMEEIQAEDQRHTAAKRERLG